MIPASLAVRMKGALGEPLPLVDFLNEVHTGHFTWVARGGQVTMIAGIPGSQKSGLAVAIAAAWAKQGIPGFYSSADMDRHTATTRLAATVSGATTSSVERALHSGGMDYYADVLDLPIHFSFNPSPSVDDIRLDIEAWVEAWDSYPRFIVIDNLLDVIPPSGDSETTGYKAILLETKQLARETGAHILILHHMSEAYGNPYMPPPRRAVMGKVTQSPENVMSVAFDPNVSQVVGSMVKHRNGPSSAEADLIFRLDASPESNSFRQHHTYSGSYV